LVRQAPKEISMLVCCKPRRVAGFSLIELMVTIAVAATLAAIVIPTYQSQIRKSRRTEARTAVMDLANREERYYSVNNDYTDSGVRLGYAQPGGADAQILDQSVGAGYYTVTVTKFNAAPLATPPTPPTFTITATAVGTQAKDTACLKFTVDDKGTQTSTPAADCWN
jgi:type IV pilus assembly protein PilE